MADGQLGDIDNSWINRQRLVGTNTATVGTAANYSSISALRTRLIAINGTYFNTSRLNTMTVNDMQYALRLADDPTTI